MTDITHSPASGRPDQQTGSLLAQIAALRTAATPELKTRWRELFGNDPPHYNRRFLENRLAYRIQELAYGGLQPDTAARLEALGEQLCRTP
jgi:hypothetical protein